MYQVTIVIDAEGMNDAIERLSEEFRFITKVGEIVAHCGRTSVRISITPDKGVHDQHYDGYESHADHADTGSFMHEDLIHMDAHEDAFVPRDPGPPFRVRILIAILTDLRSLWRWLRSKW